MRETNRSASFSGLKVECNETVPFEQVRLPFLLGIRRISTFRLPLKKIYKIVYI